ncbi:MAG TPA: AMP-dependent synthetase/ligase [Acidimicrobiales bacterium]|nr:AMP-dependent synthetase/ligase [Acidimicrobiales bacterium]
MTEKSDTTARAAAEIDATVQGKTVTRLLIEATEQFGSQTALRSLGDDGESVTYAELADRVARLASGLGSIGVGKGDRVVMMIRNEIEFHVVDLAVVACGATPISIYNSSSTDQVAYLASHCGAKVAVVGDAGFLATLTAARPHLPDLAEVVVIDAGSDTPADVHRYDELCAHDPVDLEEAATLVSPEDLATVIYTSGTTGNPKGVMLTHHNVCWTLESLRRTLEIEPVPWRVVSYLPMAHIAERMVSHYMMIGMGFEVTPLADVAGLAAALAEVRPNMMFGVPRVYEKIHGGVTAVLAADAEKFAQFNEGIAAAEPIALRRAWGEATAEDEATWEFLDSVAFAPVRQLLGLDQLEIAVTGAAPMSAELLGWFRAIGVPLSEIYGMSESTGPMNWAPRRIRPGTVGPAIVGEECSLGDDGEILVRGGNVFTGYLNEPLKTAEALDADGWLHSGDIGVLEDDGYIRIVDRKKELIVTAGGKNISPANLEAAIKDIDLVGQACVVGDKRKFVSALVTLDPDYAPVWAAERGLATDVATLADAPEVRAEIEAGLAKVMEPFNHAEQVKKFTVLADDWLPDSDVLTPTSKLKRRGIHARYADAIDAMYA